MFKPEEFMSRQRWMPAYNWNSGGGGEIPPFAVVGLSALTDLTTLRAHRLNTTDQLDLGNIAVNGPEAIPVDGFGRVTRDWPCIAYFNGGIFTGEYLGVVANQWYFDTSSDGGFMSWGMLDDGSGSGNRHGLVVPCINKIPVSDYGAFGHIARRLKVSVSVSSGPDSGGIDGNTYIMTCYPFVATASFTQVWYGHIDANSTRTGLQVINASSFFGADEWYFFVLDGVTRLNELEPTSLITPADPFAHTASSQIAGDASTTYQFDIEPWDDP